MWTAFKAISLGGKLGMLVGFLSLLFAAGAIGYVKGVSKGNEKILELKADQEALSAEYERELSKKKIVEIIKYVDRVKTVKEKEKVYIKVAQNIDPETIVITNGWVNVHDAAATGKDVTDEEAADTTPSPLEENVLPTIVSNYSQYKQCAANNNALQNIIKAHNEEIDRLNKKARDR